MSYPLKTAFIVKKIFLSLTLGVLCIFSASTQNTIPHLKNNQLIVDGKPYLMIAGELHNSSASSIPYMEALWPKLKDLNLNTVLASVSWDQFEPEEGKFDYELIDDLIANAEKNDLKLVIIWFASWKNGQSSYAPVWVKQDTKRFPRVMTKEGKLIETLSVFSEQTRQADANAFAALMKRIKEVDKNNTVIMMQPENEVGIFQDIDYQPVVLKKYEEKVPVTLMTYLQKNKKNLKPEVSTIWNKAGGKTSGTWKQVFGDTPQAKEFFMAWNYASYMNHVAAAGRKELNLPMFVNAWIVQQPEDLPGVYPNGGPVSRVMDIYKAAAPSIDIICPDIYLPNYQDIYAMYTREDNPLLVPESSLDPARAFYAFAEYNAICFSPFGIEDAAGDILYRESYALLNEISHLITQYQYTGKMRGIHLTGEEQDRQLTIGEYQIDLKIQDPEKPAFGLIIQSGETEFIVTGMNFKAIFSSPDQNDMAYIGQVTEGHYEDKRWVGDRWLNGDETYHHELLRAMGRSVDMGSRFQLEQTDLEVDEGEQFVYSPGGSNAVITPGIYKVNLYFRSK